MKYLRKFENNAAYESATLDLPSVAYCEEEHEVHYNPYIDPYAGHDYVDLGLPSGTLWATMNVGATSETGYGLYFQWGDTQGYTADQVGSGEGQKFFGWETYKYGNGTSSPGNTGMSKYNATDGKTVLEAADDAAVVNWGGLWHMPTEAQCRELFNTANCTKEWTTVNGVNGRLFTSVKNGNTLFIPAAGECNGGNVFNAGNFGYVWASSLDSSEVSQAGYFSFHSDSGTVSSFGRFNGFSVRPVIG